MQGLRVGYTQYVRFLEKLSVLLASGNIFAENQLEQGADQGLDKEQLGKESEGEVVAHQLQPVSQQSEQIETGIVGVVEPCGDKAHGGAHQTHCSADNGTFKQDGVSGTGIKNFTGQLEGAGTAHHALQCVGEDELYNNDYPDGHGGTAQRNAAHCIDSRQNAGSAGEAHKQVTIDHIQAVKDIGMDGDDYCEQGENHSLKLIAWHK